MMTKTYLFANPHPTAGLAFSGGDGDQRVWGFRAGGESGRFILRHLISKYGKQEGVSIYNKYNQALLEIKDCGMIGDDANGNQKKIGCIVLYQNTPEKNDNKISLSEQGSEGVD